MVMPFSSSSSPVQAFELKRGVTYRQGLVHDQHIGIDICRNGESQTHEHTARICSNRTIDELTDIGKLDYLVEAFRNLLLAQSKKHGIEDYVFPAGVLHVETGPSSNNAATLSGRTTCPLVGRKVPASICSKVDFPEPLQPITPTTSPGKTWKLTFRRAQNSE